MKIKFVLTVMLVAFASALFAQKTNEMYLPREYGKAYKDKTRSPEGIPGENYFQNSTDYNIKAEFFPETKLLVGRETITYKNNSPDSLSWLYINLYQNIFKKGEARVLSYDSKNIHKGVEIARVAVNGVEIDSKTYYYYSTFLAFPVASNLAPGSENKIEIEWSQKMPQTALFRIGTYDESNFFIGLWYPKMNVYDDVVGWNTFGYSGNAEFYSDYGDFDVEIIVPSEYIVLSSGVLQNANEILQDKYIERLQKASSSDEVIHIISKEDRDENKITQSSDKHNWKFKASDLPDFAFSVSNKYLWDATSAKVSDKRIIVNAMYSPSSENFRTVAEISKKSIEYYSNIAPAIPYPYPQFTVFNGAKNGMEFPGIINDQEEDSEAGTLFLTSHEIAHTYFPFYVGTNEQEHAWMDEGLATIIGMSAMADIMGTTEMALLSMATKKYHMQSAKMGIDIPPMTGSHDDGDFTYGFITYIRPITAFTLLFDYMGKEKFYEAVREFSERWKGKHPLPYDLFYTFNKVADEDLAWFWEPWFFELGYADIGIGEVENADDKTYVNIDNLGSFPIPVKLLVRYKDGTEESINLKMNIWKAGIKSYKIEIPNGAISEIVLDTNTPETYYGNNTVKF